MLYSLSTLVTAPDELSRLNTYRANRRRWWNESCEYDSGSFRFLSSTPPKSVDDPYWSRRVGLEVEPPFKTAEQWSRSQLSNRALPNFEQLGSFPSPLDYENCPRLTRSSVKSDLIVVRARKVRSETRPQPLHKCRTSVRTRPIVPVSFPPGK